LLLQRFQRLLAAFKRGEFLSAKSQQSKPDLVILDFSMPVMNGVEAAKVFKQVMPEVPILMLTAHFGVADEAAKDLGVLGVFSKDNIAPLVKQTRTILKMREL
jgi:CheY-like chemotaxis protein